MPAKTKSEAVLGVDAYAVDAESAPGPSAYSTVGLPDTAVRENKERIRAAVGLHRLHLSPRENRDHPLPGGRAGRGKRALEAAASGHNLLMPGSRAKPSRTAGCRPMEDMDLAWQSTLALHPHKKEEDTQKEKK